MYINIFENHSHCQLQLAAVWTGSAKLKYFISLTRTNMNSSI